MTPQESSAEQQGVPPPGARPQPDVTVVVPVYDAMPYLPGCLDSLLAQTIGLQRIQVVTVDDGSTDGGGELLDRYAAEHPSVFVVRHQANSGGPARPCNVGLDLAEGRYVFFLGADDHLGPEALERMVAHADAWGSDVLCVKMVGTGGRWVSQALFQHNDADVDFPTEDLAMILSNTKLFRRQLLEDHAIRYALDMRVGSDQPFTIDAMRHASRISVAADYDYYFAVRRDDSANLSYTSTWRHRLDAMTLVVRYVAPLLEPGQQRDTILQRHFHHEVARLLREDYHELDADEQHQLVEGVDELASDYLTDGVLARLTVLARLRYLLVRERRHDELRATANLEDSPPTLLAEAEDIFWCLPEPIDLALEHRRISRERPGVYLGDFLTATTGSWSAATTLDLRLTARLHPDSRPAFRLVLMPSRRGVSRPPLRYVQGVAPVLTTSVTWDDGELVARLDLDQVPAGAGSWSVRLLIPAGEHLNSVPVPFPTASPPPDHHLVDGRRVGLEQDPSGRLILRSTAAVDPPAELPRRSEGRSLRTVARGAVRRARSALRKD